MNYALATLWHDRQRYLPGILAVTFSAVLIALQGGLLLGLFSITSLPIDHAGADVWVGSPNVASLDLGEPVPQDFLARHGQQALLSARPSLAPEAYTTKAPNRTIGGCHDSNATRITTRKMTTNGTLFFRLNALKLQYLKLLTMVSPANTVTNQAHQRSGSGS